MCHVVDIRAGEKGAPKKNAFRWKVVGMRNRKMVNVWAIDNIHGKKCLNPGSLAYTRKWMTARKYYKVFGHYGFHVFTNKDDAQRYKEILEGAENHSVVVTFYKHAKLRIVKVECSDFIAGGPIPKLSYGSGLYCETWMKMRVV